MDFEHPLQEQNRRKVIQLQRDMQPHKISTRITKAITTIIEKAFMSVLLFIGQCITITTIGWQSYLLVHIATIAPSLVRLCFIVYDLVAYIRLRLLCEKSYQLPVVQPLPDCHVRSMVHCYSILSFWPDRYKVKFPFY